MPKDGWRYPERNERAGKLRAAADFVERIPLEEFRMDDWWLPDGMAYDDERNTRYRVRDGRCGCAVGHMTNSELFNLSPDDIKNQRQRVFVILGDTFGVPYKVAEFMFDQYAYNLRRDPTPQDVAKRIRYVADECEALTCSQT